MKEKRYFSWARGVLIYDDASAKAIHRFKYNRDTTYSRPLGSIISSYSELKGLDMVIPVPLHIKRLRERGFNQSRLLARRVGTVWGVPVRADVLARAAATLPQTDLGAEDRRANVRGAFTLRRPGVVVGRHVLLVDDIMTTGATAGECAALLRDAGAATVGVVTVARVV